MRGYTFYGLALAGLVVVLAAGSYAVAGSNTAFSGTPMVGYQENPDISTVARGEFTVDVSPDRRSLSYVLSYSGLEGTVQQAHIHFGKRAVNGGISIWLCANGTLRTGQRANLPECPQSGTVTDTVDMTAVVGPVGQGIEPQALGELLTALELGFTYANVHTTKWPGGEIRGQIGSPRGAFVGRGG
jgi:hypothetical protein